MGQAFTEHSVFAVEYEPLTFKVERDPSDMEVEPIIRALVTEIGTRSILRDFAVIYDERTVHTKEYPDGFAYIASVAFSTIDDVIKGGISTNRKEIPGRYDHDLDAHVGNVSPYIQFRLDFNSTNPEFEDEYADLARIVAKYEKFIEKQEFTPPHRTKSFVDTVKTRPETVLVLSNSDGNC
jgi:hypothetical protein